MNKGLFIVTAIFVCFLARYFLYGNLILPMINDKRVSSYSISGNLSGNGYQSVFYRSPYHISDNDFTWRRCNLISDEFKKFLRFVLDESGWEEIDLEKTLLSYDHILTEPATKIYFKHDQFVLYLEIFEDYGGVKTDFKICLE